MEVLMQSDDELLTVETDSLKKHAINLDDANFEDDMREEDEGTISIGVNSDVRYNSVEETVSQFDNVAGRLWIYPTNFPFRDYQYNIVKQALFKNTLVVLPTGLGKTFIAAVIMYNMYRWFPQSKVVFMAPTKPLVAQQMNACYEIMGIPTDDTIELT
ncbi:ATP-dependent DNA helicase fml1, partial [Biomphalaria glabrata]